MIIRKSAFNIDSEESDAFKTGCDALIKSGEYVKFVSWHEDMGSYAMHSMGLEGNVGMWRFLAWHRIYLLRFEEALRKHQPKAYIPYWKWTENKIPGWITTYTPKVPDRPSIARDPSLNGYKVSQQLIDEILEKSTFEEFSSTLERGPHNALHNAVGGVMNSITSSPTDPLFWLHHANVDRLWASWQSKQPASRFPGKGGSNVPKIEHPDNTLPKAQRDAFVSEWSNLKPFNASLATASRATTLSGYKYE